VSMENKNLKLQPLLELARRITDSPLCEINIIDSGSQSTLVGNETEKNVISPDDNIFNDTIRGKEVLEIMDLTRNPLYKDRSYRSGKTTFRYYCGSKLTTSKGINIGVFYVLNTTSKRLSDDQKEQFKLIAHAVVQTLESDSNYNLISNKFDSLSDSLHKLNHDVRSPINGIIGMADLLIEDKDRIEVPTQDIIMIKESAESIIGIIDGILTARVNQNNSEQLPPDKNSLANILETIKRLYSPQAQNKNLTLSLSNQLDPEINVSYYLSINLLQIIGNLVSNAIKFTPEKGSIEVNFSGSTVGKQNFLNITVKDNGKSMSSDQVSAINNGKPMARSMGTNGEKSFGIGLQHVIQIVSEEGGTISVTSGRGNGTQFSMSLPMSAGNVDVPSKSSLHLNHESFTKPTVNGKQRSSDTVN
jgi:signal transduction histidine kinase